MFERIDLLKNELDRYKPFEMPLLDELKNYYRVGLTYTTNAIEGNTLTESETKVLIEDNISVGGKPLKELFEVSGHAKAYDYMFTILNKKIITEKDILNFHTLFYSSIDIENAGVYRKINAFKTGSKYPVSLPCEIKKDIEKLCKWIEESREKLHPIEFSAKIHKKIVFIHPFVGGNGRIARLLMNTALIQAGYILAIIPPIIRAEYISFLEKAHRDDGDFIEFIGYRVYETQRDIMKLLKIPIPKFN